MRKDEKLVILTLMILTPWASIPLGVFGGLLSPFIGDGK
jgi:hypothetical protein